MDSEEDLRILSRFVRCAVEGSPEAVLTGVVKIVDMKVFDIRNGYFLSA